MTSFTASIEKTKELALARHQAALLEQRASATAEFAELADDFARQAERGQTFGRSPQGEDDRAIRLAQLIERHGPGLRRVARAYAARSSETEDLLQEIAMGLWRALPSFRGDCSERTFVFRVAHNRGVSFAERVRARPSEPLDEQLAAGADPEERLSEERRRGTLFSAIHQMNPAARTVLMLALEGLSHEEIGAVLGLTANNVGVRLSRARAELKKLLGGPHAIG